MTVPDIRVLPADELAKTLEETIKTNEDLINQIEASRSISSVKECVGYICATAIIIAMLYFDGMVALVAGSSVAGAMAGINISRRLRND